MYTRWTQHLGDETEKEKFRKQIYNARFVLERLMQMIEEDEKGLDSSEINPKTYSEPSWAYLQAHKNGVRQYIKQMKTLLNLDQQKGI